MTIDSDGPRKHRIQVQVRFGDTDMMGHVNHVSLVQYFETARLTFLESLGLAPRNGILARVAVDFRRQVQVDDQVYVDTWVTKIGRTSFTLSQTIVANETGAANSDSVMVMFDYDTQRPVAVTDGFRSALDGFRVGSS